MVGVPKSTGCAICRKRKIKCDETWPTCKNCRKNGKLCPGPPARHTFKDLGPLLDDQSKVYNTDNCVAAKDEGHGIAQLTHLFAKRTETGAVVLKFRLSQIGDEAEKTKRSTRTRLPSAKSSILPWSTLHSPLSTSPSNELARALVDTMRTEHIGYAISDFGPFMHEVPRRIGHNAALDAAATCLIYTCTAALRTEPLVDLESPRLYLTAVQKLQCCLADPTDGMSSNTLCAAVLLSLVEALAGPRIDNSYLAHVGGAGRLLEIQGSGICQDSFAKEILRFTRGGVIVTSIYNTESCFLLSPEWRDIAFDNTASSLEEHLYTNVLSLLAELSVLLKDLKELNPLLMTIKQPPNSILAKQSFDIEGTLRQYLSPDIDPETANTPLTASDLEYISVPDPQMESRLRESYPLLNKAYALKSSLHTTAAQLGCHLTDGSFAQELPNYGPSNPLPTFYRFPRWRTARVYTIHWSLTILLNKTLLKLLPKRDPSRYALEAECRTVALEICKSWENAWANRPIGACHVWLGFVVAYEFCGDEVQTWVLESLNRLLKYQGVGEWKWTEEVVGLMCKRLMGEGDVLSSMGVR